MMNFHNIFNEISRNKYHSAIFTSFSINLYYWDIQVMKALRAKGIENVSALIDDECLSDQLQNFSYQIGASRAKTFSLFGYRAKGAFHPKIMFFAGNDSVLVFVGSGNLTSCGHGGNLEIWNSIGVSSTTDPTYPVMRDIWNYLKGLYVGLGEEGSNLIRSVEDNCSLLLGDDHESGNQEYPIDDKFTISFFHDGAHENIFDEMSHWIGDDVISEIVVMSPFYDDAAKLLHALDDRYHPKVMKVIRQTNFGSFPQRKKLPDNCKVYLWDDCVREREMKKMFHAKCFFFRGRSQYYFVCGSANASVAAMGLSGVPEINHEACIGYKSSVIDYWAESGITLGREDYSDESQVSDGKTDRGLKPLWIKEASYEFNFIRLSILSNDITGTYTIRVVSADRKNSVTHSVKVKEGENEVEYEIEHDFIPLFVWVEDTKGERVSNNQFMISRIGVESSDPSADNLGFRRNIHQIEQGNFFNPSVIRFFEDVLSDKDVTTLKSGVTAPTEKMIKDDKNAVTYETYEEYKKDNHAVSRMDKRISQASYRAVSLMDSIISYINKSSESHEDDQIDEEEMEDVSQSTGKEKPSRDRSKLPAVNSLQNYLKRMHKALKEYENRVRKATLLSLDKYASHDYKDLTLQDLKQYLTAVFVVNRYVGHCARLVGTKELYDVLELMPIAFNEKKRNTVTEFIYRMISSFGLSVIQHDGIKAGNKFEENKIEKEKAFAFELSVALLSVCEWLTGYHNDYTSFSTCYKAMALLNLKKGLDYSINEKELTNVVNKIYQRIDLDIRLITDFDESSIKQYISRNVEIMVNANVCHANVNLQVGEICFDQKFGFVKNLGWIGKAKSLFKPYTMSGSWHQDEKKYFFDYAYNINNKQLLKLKVRKS